MANPLESDFGKLVTQNPTAWKSATDNQRHEYITTWARKRADEDGSGQSGMYDYFNHASQVSQAILSGTTPPTTPPPKVDRGWFSSALSPLEVPGQLVKHIAATPVGAEQSPLQILGNTLARVPGAIGHAGKFGLSLPIKLLGKLSPDLVNLEPGTPRNPNLPGGELAQDLYLDPWTYTLAKSAATLPLKLGKRLVPNLLKATERAGERTTGKLFKNLEGMSEELSGAKSTFEPPPSSTGAWKQTRDLSAPPPTPPSSTVTGAEMKVHPTVVNALTSGGLYTKQEAKLIMDWVRANPTTGVARTILNKNRLGKDTQRFLKEEVLKPAKMVAIPKTTPPKVETPPLEPEVPGMAPTEGETFMGKFKGNVQQFADYLKNLMTSE